MDEIVTAVVSNLVTVLAVVVAANYGVRQFYLEKQWERRAAAYAAILDALHHMKRYYVFEEDHLGHEYGGSEESKKRREEFYQNRREALGSREAEAYAEVQRRRDIGALDVCADAVTALDAMEQAFASGRNTTDWGVHIMETSGAVSACLASMKEIAQRELRTPSPWSFWLKRKEGDA